MPLPQVTYPLDLSGMSPNNLVVGEPQTLAAGMPKRAFVPNHGPFYTKGLKVRDAATGTLLTPHTQYVATQLFADASLRTGLEVCSIIVIIDPAVSNEVSIDYQVVGGEFSSSIYAIQQLLDSLDLDARPVYWGDILGKPEQFPPAPHLHDLGDLYGFEYLVAALEGVRRAVLLGDEASHAEIYKYIDFHDTLLRDFEQFTRDSLEDHIHDYNNPHQTTKAHVGLGLVENYQVASLLEAQQGTRTDRYMTPALVRAAINALGNGDFSSHIQNMNNPHGTTKAHVGLGLVHNYDVATVQQAIDGVRNDLYLTPYLMRQAWLAWSGGTGGGGIDPVDPPPGANALPIAGFTYSGNTVAPSGVSPSWTISFASTSIAGSDATATLCPIVEWLWSFGNGATSVLENPSHVFTTSGIKSVQLTIRDALNRTATKTINISLTQQTASSPPSAPQIDVLGTNGSLTWEPNVNTVVVGYPGGSSHIAFMPVGSPTWKVRPVVSNNPNIGTGYNSAGSYYTWSFSTGSLIFNGSNVTTLQRPLNSSAPGVVTFTTSSEHLVGLSLHVDGGTRPGDSVAFDARVRCVLVDPPIPNMSIIGPRTVDVDDNFFLRLCPYKFIAQTYGGLEWSEPGKLYYGGVEVTDPAGSNNPIYFNNIGVGDVKLITLDDGVFLNYVNENGAYVEYMLGTTVVLSDAGGQPDSCHIKYTTPGTKTIRMVLRDQYGVNVATIDKTVTLVRQTIAPPLANFSFTGQTTVVEGTNPTLSFTNRSVAGSTPIYGSVWEFKLGDTVLSTFSGPTPPPLTFPLPNGASTGRVTLTVHDQYGTTSTKVTTINFMKNPISMPVPNYYTLTSWGNVPVPDGQATTTIHFQNISANGTYPTVSWLWEWGDGTTSTLRDPPAHTYNTPVGITNRTVRLTMTDSQGNSATKTEVYTFNRTI